MVTILALGSGSAASTAIGRDVTQAPATPTPDGEQTPASCLHRAVQHRDGRRPSTTWPTEFVCDNIGGIPLYSEPDGRRKIGEMLTTQSWFLCWAAGAEQTTGERIWYYTQGDISEPDAEDLEAWGYFPASMVKSADKPPLGMPPCGK
jgi:hypothetical protein